MAYETRIDVESRLCGHFVPPFSLSSPVSELPVGRRCINALINTGYRTFEDVYDNLEHLDRRINNIGPESARKITDFFREKGYNVPPKDR
jgi:hypothetical protein